MQYAFASQAQLHGHDPASAIIELAPREGEFTLREEDILRTIEEHGDSIALVIFPGIQYYSGQFFPIESVTKAAHAKGCTVGWDLAHAIGNVPMQLHDWGVDFAVWCTYKYVNSGPGGIGGLFVHEKWDERVTPNLAGWWGHDPVTRFDMPPKFSAIRGAQGFQQSNPSVLALACLLGSLDIFEKSGGIGTLREHSISLTSQLDVYLRKSKYFVPLEAWAVEVKEKIAFTIITPSDRAQRGIQLSLLFRPAGIMDEVYKLLKRNGVVGDERQPDVIRLAPAPLFNTLLDCQMAAEILESVLQDLAQSHS